VLTVAARSCEVELLLRQLNSITDDELPLEQQPWFRHAFTKEQVSEMLYDAVPGTFIVRRSSKPGQCVPVSRSCFLLWDCCCQCFWLASWLLAAGCWLAADYCLLAAGCGRC
jgi:hypothetical protein